MPSGDALCASLARARPRHSCYAVRRRRRRGAASSGDAIVDAASGLQLPLAELGIHGRAQPRQRLRGGAARAPRGRRAPSTIARVLRALQRPAAPHGSTCAELDGVDYFDDSKATNVGAAVAALDGLRGRAGQRAC